MPSTISHTEPGSRYFALSFRNVISALASLSDRSEGHAAQQVFAQQEGEDRDGQKDQESAGRDRGPVGDPRSELRGNVGRGGLRAPVGHHQREGVFVPGSY